MLSYSCMICVLQSCLQVSLRLTLQVSFSRTNQILRSSKQPLATLLKKQMYKLSSSMYMHCIQKVTGARKNGARIPTGLEAPEGISVCIRRENCQSKKTGDHLYTCSRWIDKAVKFFCYITKWYNRSSDLGGHFNGTLWL